MISAEGVRIAERQATLRKDRFFLQEVMGRVLRLGTMVSVSFFLLSTPGILWGHGFAGKRFFPTTLAVDDPFVSDELSFLGSHIKEPGEGDQPTTKSTEISLDYSKRVTPNLGISIGDSFRYMNPDRRKSQIGMGNVEVGLKYQSLKSEGHETILSLGLDAEIGGSGTRRVGAESFSVISPTFLFGKGLGDLPDSMKFLRPLAMTGAIGPNFPTRSKNVKTTLNDRTGDVEREIERNPTMLAWGFSIQYNFQYLQSFVKDVGLGTPFNRLIVLLEFPFKTCLNRGCNGQTTGFVNPGLIWFGKTMQLGIEVQIPMNERTGNHVGVLGLIHFFLDDLFPKSIGRPIFP